MKLKKFEIMLTEEQDKMLGEKARKSGFCYKSEYIRYIIFVDMSVKEKIDQIYNKIIKE